MFCSKLFFVAISLGVISVLASRHTIHHTHRHRAVAAPVVSAWEATNGTRQQSPRCDSSTAFDTSTPAASTQLPPVATTSPQQQPPNTTSTASLATHTGELTFFASSSIPSFFSLQFLIHSTAGLGACGFTNVDTDHICAISEDLFDNYPCVSKNFLLSSWYEQIFYSGYDGINPNLNPVCNKGIRIICMYI
jgi:hypothetical protein